MSLINRFISRSEKSSPRRKKDNLRHDKWSKNFGLGLSLVVLAAGGLSFVAIRSGAQKAESVADRFVKPNPSINLDIRANDHANLDALVKRKSSGKQDVVQDLTQKSREQGFKVKEALDELKKSDPNVDVTISDLTGSVEVLKSSQPLTKANRGRDGQGIALDFIKDNRKLYGLEDIDIANLHYVGESVNETSGLRLAIFEQMVNGRQVFQGELKVSIDRDGRVIQALGNLIPFATERASAIENLISPEEALVKTMARMDINLDASKMSRSAESDAKKDDLSAKVNYDSDGRRVSAESKIVYFPVAPGILIPAWSQTIWAKEADYYALVDAADGTTLFRKNIRSGQTHQARFRVYVQGDGITPADNPAPQSPSLLVPGAQPTEIAPTIVGMLTAQNLTASPLGWINDCPGGVCTAVETQTLGNNALACVDRTAGATNVCDSAGVSALDGNGRPTGNTDAFGRDRDFLGTAARDYQTTFLPAPQGGNPEAGQSSSDTAAGIAPFLRASATHQFYVANWYHDRLYTLGFQPASRNFQQNNFALGGAGNDRVLVDVQDGQAVDNANFATPADGTSGRAQMFNFTGPTIDRDGGLDAEILIHELTHGTSNRLVGNGSGLQWGVGSSMGEGWSDFYALSLLNNTNADSPTAPYASGSYAMYKGFGFTTFLDNYTYGIRRFPYSSVNTVNPLTWADVDDVTNNLTGGMSPSPLTFNNGGGMEVHNAGEVWALSLWEVRSRIIADPAGANGDVPTGNTTSMSIVTDAMRLFTPNSPTFIQARDALVDADCAANAACPNEMSIWGGFADRGLGYNAVAPIARTTGWVAGHLGIGESFEMPNLDVNTTTVVDTAIGNGNGFIDPNEGIRLTVNLRNPYRGAARNATGVTATITTSTPGITILNNTVNYPAIAAQGTANPTGGTPYFAFRVSNAATCGQAIRFTITTNSSLGTASKNIVLRVGAPAGTGAPITYTRDPNPDIAIPDNAPRGVNDTLTIVDDFEIADLNFRADSISHLKVGDLSVMLKAPNGYGTDLLSLIGGGGTTGQNGDNITNMVIDQTAAAPNDQLTALSTAQPFTDDFLPIFNTPTWASLGLAPDPVGQLDRYNGLSTLGTWNLRVADNRSVTAGTLNAWSIIVTPRAFACTPFVVTAANVYVAGRVRDDSGQAVSNATVTITNSQGEVRTTRTNPFGFYRFDDVAAGQTYFLNVSSKRHNFSPQAVNVTGDIDDLNFSPN